MMDHTEEIGRKGKGSERSQANRSHVKGDGIGLPQGQGKGFREFWVAGIEKEDKGKVR
jgi:hypothetical protein